MLRFVFGRAGTGKSEWIYRRMEQAAEKGQVYLLIPDREAVAAESRTAQLHGVGNIDVVTFGRLCNYVFRRYGGLCADYIAPGAKKLIMRNVLRAMAPALHEYGTDGGRGLVESLTVARSEFYKSQITPGDLEKASAAMEDGSPLRTKTSDLSLIFAAFDFEVASRWEDPDGMLSKACELLKGSDFFGGSTVFIDSFLSFSAVQYHVLEEVMRGADDVYITLSYLPEEDGEDASALCFADTERRLFSTAQRAGIPVMREVSLPVPLRYRNDELSYLSAHIAGTGAAMAAWTEKPAHIHLVRAADSFAEAEAAALDICRRVRGGARFRDIVVIVRDTALYEGILDTVFDKYDIAYFISSKKKITEKPLIKFVFSAFAVVERGARTQDVIAYVKSGLAGLSPDECNLFENYIVKWNIHGNRFMGDEPWTMNPRGYGETIRDEDLEVLTVLAELRRRVAGPMRSFHAAFRTARTVRTRATVLFDFLSGLGIPERLKEESETAYARGDRARASETTQLWNVFCGALDQLVVSSGDTETDTAEFSQMLGMVLADTDIGKIPTSVDEVLISDASATVPGAPRFVYLLGANEGIFPQKIGEDGLFSEYEKELLASCGVEIAGRLERRISEELYYFYRAASLPSEELYVSFSHYGSSGGEMRPSIGVKRITALFPKLEADDFERAEKSVLIESRRASFEHALAFPGNLGRALREFYEGYPEYAEKLRYMSLPLTAADTRLLPAAAEELFGGRLKTSYSRLESYIKCRFSYFCEYELKLRDRMPAHFGAVDIGSFMHGILEKTVRWIAKGETDDALLADEIEKIARDYIETIFRCDMESVPPRLRHIFRYLCRSAEIFASKIREEFAVSAFHPCDFELTVGTDGEIAPMRLCGDGTEVELRGKIDRVDAFEGDGKLYLRVIDYKTGDKTFDRKNIPLGLDLQMLLYLFSVWENGEKRYGREIVPAGVLYAGIKPPQVDIKIGADDTSEAIRIRTSGLFLQDETVLRAMDPALDGTYIPVKAADLGKDKPNLIGLEAFRELRDSVAQTVLHYAGELKKGIAYAKPLSAGGKSPCEYCKMHAVCRIGKR